MALYYIRILVGGFPAIAAVLAIVFCCFLHQHAHSVLNIVVHSEHLFECVIDSGTSRESRIV